MAISKAIREKVIKRDNGACWHCGETEAISIQHRKNRGMGGSSKLDRLDNLIVLCSAMNLAIESDADAAELALRNGWKLASWDDFSTPVFDIQTELHYLLDDKGGKGVTEPPSFLI